VLQLAACRQARPPSSGRAPSFLLPLENGGHLLTITNLGFKQTAWAGLPEGQRARCPVALLLVTMRFGSELLAARSRRWRITEVRRQSAVHSKACAEGVATRIMQGTKVKNVQRSAGQCCDPAP